MCLHLFDGGFFKRCFMNKTKKLTQGAMLLALAGALMLIDRQLSFMLETFLLLIYPVVIIVYSSMYDLKDGAVLSFGLLVIGFLFGSLTTHIYLPLAIILGIGYSYGVKKQFSKQQLLLVAVCLFILGEVLITFAIQPLLGLSIEQQLATLDEMMAAYNEAIGVQSMGINLSLVMKASFVFAIFLVGLMEGFIVHMFAIMMLRRFKIKDIGSISVAELKISPLLAYLSFVALFGIFFAQKFESNENLFVILTICYMAGAVILIYNGYLFMLVYGRVVMQKNISLILILGIILLFPFSLFILIFLGFFYGAGPLERYLERKMIQK